MPEGPDKPAAEGRPERVAAVFDQDQVALGTQGRKAGRVIGIAEAVRGHDGAGRLDSASAKASSVG